MGEDAPLVTTSPFAYATVRIGSKGVCNPCWSKRGGLWKSSLSTTVRPTVLTNAFRPFMTLTERSPCAFFDAQPKA